MYDGGFFRGHSFKSESETDDAEYFFTIAWGRLIADPKIQMFKKRKTSFTIKYHSKSFLNVVMWGDTEAAIVSSALEKGDTVFCCGTVAKTKYTLRKGEHKGEERTWYEMNCQIVVPMPSIQFLIAAHSSDALNAIIDKGEIDKGPDKFESADDYEAEASEENDGYDYEISI